MKSIATILALGLLIIGTAAAQDNPTRRIVDADIPSNAEVTFSADTTYILDGMVFVDPGARLVIEAGTVIKAEDGQGNDASGLVVTRGATIEANGTAEQPIIFTSILDDLDGSLTYQDRGLWGGVVILGYASTNNPTEGGLKQVEGVNEITGEGDDRAIYGGEDDDDNSGVFRYVSIRHSGINVGDQAGNEIQGLTLGGVGRGTVIEYVESYASADDGFEWFGGTVDTKYLVSAFNEDDAFDYDEGFRGRGQFWFAIQAPDAAGRAAEQDGAIGAEFYEPFAIPVIYNATYVGPGIGSAAQGDGAQMLIFRDNAGGKYTNSIFTEFETAEGGYAITIEDVDNSGDLIRDSRQRLEAGDIALQNNIWWDFGAGNSITEFAPQPFVQAYLSDAANANRVVDPQLRGISRERSGGLDPRPAAGSPALSGARAPSDAFFTATSFVGAFGSENWLAGWTALDQYGYLAVTTSAERATELPGGISLEQNYPNPFNPSTTIRYELASPQEVRLTVHDMLGREIAVLVDGTIPAGSHAVAFDAGGLASGVYLYRLVTGTGVQAKTMTLMK